MAARHISTEERIRREVIRGDFDDELMRKLGESGSIEAIRQRAEELAPARRVDAVDPLSVEEPEVYTREERRAIIVIRAINGLSLVEQKLAEEAAARPVRHPSELDGVKPLTRATLEISRDNL